MDNIKQEDIHDICFNVSKNIILPKYKNLKEDDIKYKNGSDLVTSADIASEKELKKNLLQIIPSSAFIGEEEYALNQKILKSYQEDNYCWTVDPIDGTTNFVKGRDKFAIMIALTKKDQILYSWIYKPLENVMCNSILNEGSFINNKKIKTNGVNSLGEAIGSISTKYWDEKNWDKIKNLKDEFAEVKSYRCIGYEYLDIGLGKRNFAILSKLSPWDHIPGILFVREAGCSDIDFDRKPYNFTKKNNNLIVGNSKEFNLQILNKLGV
tara:strand:- start:6 stop:806 length:801 start_codon:yes stop_codon:yes gene_type:complete